MSPVATLEHTARVLGWEVRRPAFNSVVMWKAGCMIDVTLTPQGYVNHAERYEFVRLDDLHFREHATGKHKKATITGWLATDW